jgi:hypothetical protein
VGVFAVGDSKDKIQQSGGLLIIAGWTAMKQMFSRSEKANELRRVTRKSRRLLSTAFSAKFAFWRAKFASQAILANAS